MFCLNRITIQLNKSKHTSTISFKTESKPSCLKLPSGSIDDSSSFNPFSLYIFVKFLAWYRFLILATKVQKKLHTKNWYNINPPLFKWALEAWTNCPCSYKSYKLLNLTLNLSKQYCQTYDLIHPSVYDYYYLKIVFRFECI